MEDTMETIFSIAIALFVVWTVMGAINAEETSTAPTMHSSELEQLQLLMALRARSDAADPERTRMQAKQANFDYHWPIARYMCTKSIEKLAKYDYKWDSWAEGPRSNEWFQATDYMMDIRPNEFNVHPNDFVFAGTSIKMQNGFGAWAKATFTCVYDPSSETLRFLNVHQQ
mgnify:FL=1